MPLGPAASDPATTTPHQETPVTTSTHPVTFETTLGAVLSHTTGRLVADLRDVFALQDYLVGRPLWTHERPRPEHDVTTVLLAQFPRLAEAEFPGFPDGIPNVSVEHICRAWVDAVADHTGYGHHVTVRAPQ